mgnify:CR=1 FL=1
MSSRLDTLYGYSDFFRQAVRGESQKSCVQA